MTMSWDEHDRRERERWRRDFYEQNPPLVRAADINPLGVRDAIEMVMHEEFELRRTEVHDAHFRAVISQAMRAPSDAAAMLELLAGLKMLGDELLRAMQLLIEQEERRLPGPILIIREPPSTPPTE